VEYFPLAMGTAKFKVVSVKSSPSKPKIKGMIPIV
jgi:hypothetical protein